MPKAACRIWLQITDIRVERLQQISHEDAIAEGIEFVDGFYKNYLGGNGATYPVTSYNSLWRKINGEDSWNLNPWVWVIEFDKIKKP